MLYKNLLFTVFNQDNYCYTIHCIIGEVIYPNNNDKIIEKCNNNIIVSSIHEFIIKLFNKSQMLYLKS